jgi:hypothetical protein
MAENKSNSVRNGVIATVVGGIALAALSALWPAFKRFLLWLWEQVMWFGSFFTDSYSLKGWILGGLILLALPTAIRFLLGLKPQDQPAFTRYVDDMLFKAKWRWTWLGSEISNLWCFCPQCDSELVYDDSSCRNIYSREPEKTLFICEHCGHLTIASIVGGDKDYAISAVKREIRRRIRTNEYQQT